MCVSMDNALNLGKRQTDYAVLFREYTNWSYICFSLFTKTRKLNFSLLLTLLHSSGYAPQRPLGAFEEEGRFLLGGWRYPPPKQLQTFPGHPEEVVLVVNEILSYRHIDRQTSCHFILSLKMQKNKIVRIKNCC